MKTISILVIGLMIQLICLGQSRYLSKDGKITFTSKAPLETIEAKNNKAVSVFDIGTGALEFSVLMKGFEFDKAKMQEHFNENYVESDKYPKAVYTGKIEDVSSLKITRDGSYPVKVSGTLNMHGVTKPQSAQAVFTVKGGNISAVSELVVYLSDYNVQIPSLVAEKVSKTVRITINVPSYKPM